MSDLFKSKIIEYFELAAQYFLGGLTRHSLMSIVGLDQSGDIFGVVNFGNTVTSAGDPENATDSSFSV